MEERLLEVKDLKVSFNVGKKKLTAVENVEFSLDKDCWRVWMWKERDCYINFEAGSSFCECDWERKQDTFCRGGFDKGIRRKDEGNQRK